MRTKPQRGNQLNTPASVPPAFRISVQARSVAEPRKEVVVATCSLQIFFFLFVFFLSVASYILFIHADALLLCSSFTSPPSSYIHSVPASTSSVAVSRLAPPPPLLLIGPATKPSRRTGHEAASCRRPAAHASGSHPPARTHTHAACASAAPAAPCGWPFGTAPFWTKLVGRRTATRTVTRKHKRTRGTYLGL